MDHSLSASASALRKFNSLRCAVSTTFFLVFVKFFHRSGEAVFVSAVREATQSSTACQQLFPLFDFFFHSTRCRRREVTNLFVSALAVNNFFFSFRKILSNLSPARRHDALSVLVKLAPRPSAFRLRPAREAFMGSFAPKVKKFFQIFLKKAKPRQGRGHVIPVRRAPLRHQKPFAGVSWWGCTCFWKCRPSH